MNFLLGAILSIVVVNAQAQTHDNRYEIKRVTVTEIADSANNRNRYIREIANNFSEGCDTSINPHSSSSDSSQNPVDVFDIALEKVINIGKKIWAIIDDGRPVVNLRYDYAHALPSGIKCWTEMEGWKMPSTKLYQAVYENGFGAKVIDYAFRISFVPGGSYNGKGKYITMATIQPTKVVVTWGYTFDAVATVPIVFNQGTKSDPIGAMQLVMNWQVSTSFKTIQRAESFYINGLGQLQQLKPQ